MEDKPISQEQLDEFFASQDLLCGPLEFGIPDVIPPTSEINDKSKSEGTSKSSARCKDESSKRKSDITPQPGRAKKLQVVTKPTGVFSGLVFCKLSFLRLYHSQLIMFSLVLIPHVRSKLFTLKRQAYQDAGAKVVTTATEAGISHYILIKKWTYEDALKSLKLNSIPNEVVLVSDEWAADCIEQEKLIDVRSYLVKRQTKKEPIPKKEENETKKATNIKEVVSVSPASSSSITPPDSPWPDPPIKQQITKQTIMKPSTPQATTKKVTDTIHTSPARSTDELDVYIQKANLHGLIEDYLSSDDDNDDDIEKQSEAEREITRPEADELEETKKKWTGPKSLLLSKPANESLDNNPNWRTIEVVSTVADFYDLITF